MSLLLDALRRAEEDSRKRRLGASESVPQAELPPELSLQELAAPDKNPPLSSGLAAQAHATPANSSFPELTLALADPPVLAPEAQPPAAVVLPPASARTPVQPYGRYARPTGAQADQEARFVASQSRAGTQSDIRLNAHEANAVVAPPYPPLRPEVVTGPSAEADQNVPQQTRAAERRALSAAGVMAGKARPRDSGKRRQWLLAVSALVLAVPLVVFLFFGDALFGSKSTLLVANKPRVAAALPEGMPALAAGDLAVTSAAPAPQPAVAALPAVSIAASSPVVAGNPYPARLPSQSAPAPAASNVAAARPTAIAQRPRPVTRVSPQGAVGAPADVRDTFRSQRGGAQSVAAVSLMPNAARPASLMDAAYAAYQAGKPAEATRLYQDVLRADPTQRDAWLGLAVIAHASNQREPAMDAYKRVLRLEPQNATALAGLSSLITNAGEPQQESRLREMLARAPQKTDLNNALGLVLSGEQRWSEAQPLFFKAHSAAPQEAQFAYNLAVTLDHLRKSALAAQYYETALGLATGKVSGFDEASARNRLTALRARGSAGLAR